MALIEFVDSLSPPWSKGGAVPHWLRFFRFAALAADLIIEGIYQGKKESFPNQVDVPGFPMWGGYTDTIALTKYLGPDAGVAQGLTETIPDFAQRVRGAQGPNGWPAGGSVKGLFAQLAGVLSGPGGVPKFAIVDRHSQWTVRNTDGTVDSYNLSGTGLHYDANWNVLGPNSTVATQWAWDTFDVPDQPGVPDRNGAGEWWLLVWTPLNLLNGAATNDDFTFVDIGLFRDRWDNLSTICPVPNFPDEGTIGSNLSVAMVNAIVAVIKAWQTSGFECSHLILAFDPASFAPDGSSTAGPSRTSYPDGLWGEECCVVGGVMVPSRLQTARYIAVGPWAYRSNVP